MEQMQLFAGLDAHSETITGTIKDEAGNPVRVLKVETSKGNCLKNGQRFVQQIRTKIVALYTLR